MLSQKAKSFQPSPTLMLAAKAKEMKDRGEDVISLTVGEPDWPTYAKACDAGIQAIRDGKTKYTASQGIPALRKAIAQQMKVLTGQDYDPAKEVAVTSGAKFVAFSAFKTLLDPQQEVIIPAPFWASYKEMVELADGVARIVKTQFKNNLKITPDELEKAINPKTKIFLLNSPSNPTGVEYSAEDLKALAVVLRKHPNVAVVSDDIYNQLSFCEKGISPHLLQVAPDLRDRVICVNGASKAYSMTGWRMGWAAGEKSIIHAMVSYQSQTMGAPSSISQEATLAGILHCDADLVETRKELRARCAHAYEAFSSIPGMKIAKPDGAFYLWIDISEILKKTGLKTGKDFSQMLLEKQKLVLVPGDDFGDDQCIRISFVVDKKSVDRAVERIKAALA
ncbi:pyridoxal phosphate-dependent aminotransferase [bacterium]|nr:pyridoxal phosphate-dependent aminotransferase [bacterium]